MCLINKSKNIMKTNILIVNAIFIATLLTSCSDKEIRFDKENLQLANNIEISITEKPESTLKLIAKPLGGMAILKNVRFSNGTIDLELKGENNPGKSFVGIAFNIQNDSTYESIYFRPFNFESKEKRGNAIQYISQPKNTWSYLRKNFKGQYESEYINAPSGDDWFSISVKIDSQNVSVYDKKSNIELLKAKRLEKQVSDKVGLWTGNNSKGEFRKVTILK
jgi:hypothetical protein